MSAAVQLQNVSQEYQKLQVDYSNAVEARQKLEAQLSENEFVKKVQLIHIHAIYTDLVCRSLNS
jgi:chaperonin cofactor prefoldin